MPSSSTLQLISPSEMIYSYKAIGKLDEYNYREEGLETTELQYIYKYLKLASHHYLENSKYVFLSIFFIMV